MKAWPLNPNAKTFQTVKAEQEAKQRCLLSEAPVSLHGAQAHEAALEEGASERS